MSSFDVKKLGLISTCLIGLFLAVPAYAVTQTVVMETTMGDIVIELFPQDAPITVDNFLQYVNSGFYNGLIFHRVYDSNSNATGGKRIFIVQSGGYNQSLEKVPVGAPIDDEYGRLNVRGTIAMAKTGATNSATSQFFFNLDDASLALDPDHQSNGGFTVFGEVITGMDVVDAISMVETNGANGTPLANLPNGPNSPIIINRAWAPPITVSVDGNADFNSIQAAIDDPGVVDAMIIEVQPGIYYENINFNAKAITLTSIDPDDDNVVRDTVIDGGGAIEAVRFGLGEDSNSILTGFTIRNAQVGIRCHHSDPLITKCQIEQNSGDGIVGRSAEPIIKNCLILDNGDNGISDCGGNITNCTIAGNKGSGIYLDDFTVSLTLANNIIVSNGGYGIRKLSGDITLSYNNVWDNFNGGYNVSIAFDVNDSNNDPCFADPCEGDYHLKSAYGRWTPPVCRSDLNDDRLVDFFDFSEFALFWKTEAIGLAADLNNDGIVDIYDLSIFADNYLNPNFVGAWVQDVVNSLSIDAGNPSDDVDIEAFKNGDRVNQGAYGATKYSSKSEYQSCGLVMAGDLNDDCRVDFVDYSIFANLWIDGDDDDTQKLSASDGDDDDRFGYAVSTDGDYAIVGAPYDSDIANRAGAAYIFKRDQQGWNQLAKLTASDAAAYDWFGHAVSISGNYAIVSAPQDDDNGSKSGSVYIFEKPSRGWADANDANETNEINETIKLTASAGAADDWFGHSVAIEGKWVIVGASGDNAKKGAVYFFEPIGKRVLIRKDEDKKQTKGGIQLPDNIEIPTITGRIVTISAEVESLPEIPLRQYDKVLFNPKGAIPVDFEGDNRLFVVEVENVVAVFRKD